MSRKIEIQASARSQFGTAASRRLRRLEDQVPGVIYGGDAAPQPLSLKRNALDQAMQQEAFHSQVLTVVVDGVAQQAVAREVQRHPASDRALHVDFLRIRADQPVHVQVPLHFINEDHCVGVRSGGGSIVHNLIEVEISALPADLPEFIEVDVRELAVGQSLHLSDLKLPSSLTLVALIQGADHDIPVISVQPPRGGADEEEEEAEAAAAEATEADEAGEKAS